MNRAERREAAIAARKDPNHTRAWIAKYQAGDPVAADILLRAHDPLIASIARRWCHPGHRDWDDCIQQGRLGLLRGAQRHDLGEAVMSYLWTWARSLIGRWAQENGQVVRLPVRLFQKNGPKRARASVWKPRSIMFSEIDAQYTDDMAYSFEDTLISDEPLAPDVMTDDERRAISKRVVAWLFSRLEPREAEVLYERFRRRPKTLIEIGEERGLTRERIRQIEANALERCRWMLPRRSGRSLDEWLAIALRRVEANPNAPRLSEAA